MSIFFSIILITFGICFITMNVFNIIQLTKIGRIKKFFIILDTCYIIYLTMTKQNDNYYCNEIFIEINDLPNLYMNIPFKYSNYIIDKNKYDTLVKFYKSGRIFDILKEKINFNGKEFISDISIEHLKTLSCWVFELEEIMAKNKFKL